MSDNLRKLIEAVEAGDLSTVNNNLGVMYSELGNHWPWDWISKVNSAFRGSLDAAIALCEVLLPGWEWAVYGRGPAHLWKQLASVNADNSIPARAMLLAVLQAKLTEMENE